MKLHRSRFTLVEILVTLAIISLLAGIGFGGYSYAMNSARESSTKALLKQLEAGLSAVRAECGYYPKTENYGMIEITFNSDNTPDKVKFGGTELNKAARQAFLKMVDIESIRKNIDDNHNLTDSWGTPIYYCHVGKINTTGYDLLAAGEDGKFSEDLKKEPDNSPALSKFTNSDDLTNF